MYPFSSCLVNIESKVVPVPVPNVRDERIRLLKEMHLGNVTEATDKKHVLQTVKQKEK